jgi:cell division septation protein DedD
VSKVFEFALSAKQAAVIAGCLALAGLLVSVAGFAVGLLVASNPNGPLAWARPEIPKPALRRPAVPMPQLKKPEAAAKSPEIRMVVPPLALAAGPSEETKTAPAETKTAPGETKTAVAETKTAVAETKTAAAGPAPGDKGNVPVPASAAAAAKPAPLPIRIAVQVGSFSMEDNARDVLERLKRFGYPATSFSMTDGRNRQWHVVQVGP